MGEGEVSGMGDGLQIEWTVAMAAPPPLAGHMHMERERRRVQQQSPSAPESQRHGIEIALHEFGGDLTV